MKRSRFFHRHLHATAMRMLVGCVLIMPLHAEAQSDLAIAFGSPIALSSGKVPNAIRTADINHDGKYDLITCFENTPAISILLNQSMGRENVRFGEEHIISFDRGNASELITADIDRDGNTDIILLDETEHAIVILINRSSTENIQFAEPVFLNAAGMPKALCACDLNMDGSADIITSSGNELLVYKNTSANGNISFDNAISIQVGSPVLSLKCADIDGDGNADIIAGTGDRIAVMQNKTQWGSAQFLFDAPMYHFTFYPAFTMEVGDLDGDFKPEIITADWPQAGFTVLHNSSEGGKPLVDTVYIFETNAPTGIALGDFNMDGKFDVATTASADDIQSAEIFSNISRGNGSILFAAAEHLNPAGDKIVTGDFDGDGKDDFATANSVSDNVMVWVHNATRPLANLSVPETYCGEDGLVWISWTSSLESNNLQYTIEKTTDGCKFVQVSTVSGKAATGSDYSVVDTHPSLNVAYYRIRITDNKGALQTTSLTPLIPCENIVSDFTCVFPNPVHDVMNFQFSVKAATGMHFEIMDTQMKVQLEKTENITAGTRTYSLDVSKLPSGSYLLAVRFGNLPPKVCRFEKM